MLGSLGDVNIDTWYEVDLTSLITADGTYSLRISDSVGGADYTSKEGSNSPKLLVALGGATPQSCAPAATATPTPGPTNTPTNTPTPGPSPTPTNTPTATPTNQPPAAFNNATFAYDGDGRRVKSIFNGTTTTYFVGAHYEVTGSTITKYYYAGAQRIAMRTNGTVNYLLGDHLGSTSLTTDANGQNPTKIFYKAWGEVRYASDTAPTHYTYTGQYSYTDDFGLMFYNARWYDPALGRFAQADTIIPGGVQGYDRYAYSNNNPIRYTDPSGHWPCLACALNSLIMVALRFNDIINAPPIKDPRSSPPTSPAETTTWLINVMNTNAASEYTQEMNSQIEASAQSIAEGSGLADATEAWVSLTQKDAIWDFKKDVRDNRSDFLPLGSRNVQLGDDFETHFEALANIHYGYVGAAAGFGSVYLQAGAGLKQKESEQGSITTYLDDPFDNYWIRFGIFLHNEYGQDGLTEDEFNSALNDFLEQNGDPGNPLGVEND